MSDSAKYKNSTRLIQLALISGTLIASSAWGFETNYDRGRVDFAGRVTDISCSVALNGGNNAGSGSVWLAPVSLAEVHDRGAGAFMKPQPFTLELSNCQLRHDGGAADKDEVRMVNVRWIDGFMVNSVSNENAGYLANTRADGASHIFWRCRLTTIILWTRAIKLSRLTRSKTGCLWSKRRWMAGYLLITLATLRQRRKKRPAVR